MGTRPTSPISTRNRRRRRPTGSDGPPQTAGTPGEGGLLPRAAKALLQECAGSACGGRADDEGDWLGVALLPLPALPPIPHRALRPGTAGTCAPVRADPARRPANLARELVRDG